MTLTALLDAMVAELILLFKDFRFMNQDGEYRPVTVYRQRFPERHHIDDADADARIRLPYCCVFAPGFKTGVQFEPDGDREWQASPVFLLFGVYDANEDGGSTLDIIAMAERVKQRFLLNPVLKPKFLCGRAMEFNPENIEEGAIFESTMTLTFFSKMQMPEDNFVSFGLGGVFTRE